MWLFYVSLILSARQVWGGSGRRFSAECRAAGEKKKKKTRLAQLAAVVACAQERDIAAYGAATSANYSTTLLTVLRRHWHATVHTHRHWLHEETVCVTCLVPWFHLFLDFITRKRKWKFLYHWGEIGTFKSLFLHNTSKLYIMNCIKKVILDLDDNIIHRVEDVV